MRKGRPLTPLLLALGMRSACYWSKRLRRRRPCHAARIVCWPPMDSVTQPLRQLHTCSTLWQVAETLS